MAVPHNPKEKLDWLFKQTESYMWRSHKNEVFMQSLLEMNFLQFMLTGKRKILEHLKFMLTTYK